MHWRDSYQYVVMTSSWRENEPKIVKVATDGFTSLMTLPLESKVSVPADLVRRERRMRVFHEYTEVVPGPLHKYEQKRCRIKAREMVDWKCGPGPVSYGCPIPEGKDMLAARRGVAVRRPSVRCMVTGDDIVTSQRAYENLPRETMMAERSVKEIPRNNFASISEKCEVPQKG